MNDYLNVFMSWIYVNKNKAFCPKCANFSCAKYYK